MIKIVRYHVSLLFLLAAPLISRHTLLEFKAAYFLPTNDVFKHLYNGSAEYGPELTVQLCEDKNWYGFLSIDYFEKKGRSLGLCDFTKVSLLPLGVGLKYFVPFWCDRADFYLGLGFQPVYVQTKNCTDTSITKQHRWGFGGIAKAGTYWYLPCDFFIDLFIDYSFVKVGCKQRCLPAHETITPRKANVSGALFGGGIGYRF
jgi:hypothetical protein